MSILKGTVVIRWITAVEEAEDRVGENQGHELCKYKAYCSSIVEKRGKTGFFFLDSLNEAFENMGTIENKKNSFPRSV